MTNDISESISQGFGREEDEETRRIQEIADELGRRCRLYETELRKGQANGNESVEQRVTETFAKENVMWIPISEMFALGIPGQVYSHAPHPIHFIGSILGRSFPGTAGV